MRCATKLWDGVLLAEGEVWYQRSSSLEEGSMKKLRHELFIFPLLWLFKIEDLDEMTKRLCPLI